MMPCICEGSSPFSELMSTTFKRVSGGTFAFGYEIAEHLGKKG